MIIMKSGRHPLVVTLLVFCVVSGLANLLAYQKSATNVIRAMPTALGYGYYLVLALGALVTLAGVFWRGIDGPLLERAGYWMLAGLFISYGVIAVMVAGPRALFTASILFGFALGSVLRNVQISRELRGAVGEPGHHHRDSGGLRRPGDWNRGAVHTGSAAPEDLGGGKQGFRGGGSGCRGFGDETTDSGGGAG